MTRRKRVAILISGRGSNMRALIDAAAAPDYPAEIVGVFSNRAAAPGLDYARERGVATKSLAQSSFDTREAFDSAITAVLQDWGAEIVCLAGFMRILSSGFIDHWMGRAINIHPSLLPEFKGLDPHGQAIAAGVTSSGCTVHFVTHEMDAGPIIAQAKVPVFPDDTAEALAERVLKEEHQLYPLALAQVCRGGVAL